MVHGIGELVVPALRMYPESFLRMGLNSHRKDDSAS